jgi:hypothetical protein
VLKTAAAAFAYPLKGLASAKTMQKVLNERTKELLREPNLLIIIDEAGLVPPLKRDETSEMLKLLRQSPKPDGGVKVLEVVRAAVAAGSRLRWSWRARLRVEDAKHVLN